MWKSDKIVENILGKDKLKKDKKSKNSLDLSKYKTKNDAIFHLSEEWGLDYESVVDYVDNNWREN